MCLGNGISYSYTALLRHLTKSSIPFKWSQECEDAFQLMKEILSSDKVLASFDPEKETRVYVDHGPTGLGATLAQKHSAPGLDHEVWRPVQYKSRAMTVSELD